MKPHRICQISWLLVGCVLTLWPFFGQAAEDMHPPSRPNVTILYDATISADPRLPAQVSTALRGANEIVHITWKNMHPLWMSHLKATGTLKPLEHHQWLWTPGGLTGTLTYDAVLTRPRSIKGFDSYHGGSWVLTRASDLFPAKRFRINRKVRTRTEVSFHLPEGWEVVTSMQPLSPHRFLAQERHTSMTSPHGWLLMGQLDTHRTRVGKSTLTISAPTVMHYDATPLIEFLQRIMPHLTKTVDYFPEAALIVVGPDPLWRGGLSGEDSLYLNQNLPLIARDYTSTVVHELFHIGQGFQKTDRRADWIVEGLAEYYSLRILYDAKLITARKFVKGVRKLHRQGLYGVNLTKTRHQAALYNTAPLLFFYMDETIREQTHQTHALRSVLQRLSHHERITNDHLQRALHRIAPDIPWKEIWKMHVGHGQPTPFEPYLAPYEHPSRVRK